MRPERDVVHSPPSSAVVMEEWSYTSTHYLGHTGPVTGLIYLYTLRIQKDNLTLDSRREMRLQTSATGVSKWFLLFAKYYSGDEINKNEINRARGTTWGGEKIAQAIFIGNVKGFILESLV
jgi:hypothetical protein